MKKILYLLCVLLIILAGCNWQQDNSALQNPDTAAIQNASLLTETDGYYVLGGDILLDKADRNHQALIAYYSGDPAYRGLTAPTVVTWPDGIVPYYYEGTFTNAEKDSVEAAMRSLEIACDVYFYETTPANYRLKIVKTTDTSICGSCTIGYTKNARYNIRCMGYGTVTHELMHGLGFKHEHQRPDRDTYVTIDYSNIAAGKEGNFTKITGGTTYGAYDYESIMHYGAYAFAVDTSKVTIDAKGNSIGQRTHLSNLDRKALYDLYGNPQDEFYKGDFDGNGEDDVLVKGKWGMGIQSLDSGNLTAVLFQTTGTWFGGWNFNPNQNRIDGIGDFDGDGDDDILITGGSRIAILSKSGSGFTAIVNQPSGTRFGGWLYASSNAIKGLGDFDGDGDEDFIITSTWGIGILTKSGSTFTSLVCQAVGTRFGDWLYANSNKIQGIGDFDADGDDDFIITSSWGIGILTRSGSTLTSTVCKAANTVFGSWTYRTTDEIRGIGDFDGDGDDDILITGNSMIGVLVKSGSSLTSLVYQSAGTRFGGWLYAASNTVRTIGYCDSDSRADIIITSAWGMGILERSGSSFTSLDLMSFQTPWWTWNL